MVDALDSGSSGPKACGSSNLLSRTKAASPKRESPTNLILDIGVWLKFGKTFRKKWDWIRGARQGESNLKNCESRHVKSIGVWLSLVEHYVRDVGAGGSNPLTPTNKKRLQGLFLLVGACPPRESNLKNCESDDQRLQGLFLLVGACPLRESNLKNCESEIQFLYYYLFWEIKYINILWIVPCLFCVVFMSYNPH